MAVTKQTYTATATWTYADLANLFRDAFIDAGLMTDWHDAFVTGSNTARVLKIEHDNTKTYGSSFYHFSFVNSDHPGISIVSGWNTSTDVPTGTQFLDYHRLPATISGISINYAATAVTPFAPSTSSDIFLDRFTSADDTKQSWFVFRQGLNRSAPFTILHKNTSLHPWLDLNKGIVNGYSTIGAIVVNNQGYVDFRLQENIRRCLLTGQTLRGDTEATFGNTRFHAINYRTHSYTGFGSASNSTNYNYSSPSNGGSIILPVAKNSANPAFTTDHVPICTSLPWSSFTPTLLADDFGIYMHYADNATAYGDKFIVETGVNEWEVLQFANNPTVVDGASPAFLARVV